MPSGALSQIVCVSHTTDWCELADTLITPGFSVTVTPSYMVTSLWDERLGYNACVWFVQRPPGGCHNSIAQLPVLHKHSSEGLACLY